MRTHGRCLAPALLLLAIALSAPISAVAQTCAATLTGTVTDSNGGVVPNVKVTAINQDTNESYTAVSSDAGYTGSRPFQ